MMKLFVIALGALATSVPAQAQMTLDGLVRTGSLFHAVARACPQYMLVDVQTALKLANAAKETLDQQVGPLASDQMMGAEISRRMQEVQISGPQQWCTYQRERPQSGILFPRRRR